MSEIPDLSKLNGSKPPEPEQPSGPVQARTAFLVVVDAKGNIQVSTNTTQDVEVDHECTTDDIFTACSLILKDIQVQQTAGLVQASLMQMGAAMQQQAMNEQIRQRINLK